MVASGRIDDTDVSLTPPADAEGVPPKQLMGQWSTNFGRRDVHVCVLRPDRPPAGGRCVGQRRSQRLARRSDGSSAAAMIATAAGPSRDWADVTRRALLVAGACVLSILVAAKLSAPSLLVGLGAVAFAGVAVWMFLSEKLELPCIALALYLGMVDGFVKLATGAPFVTLGRDILLYAIVTGSCAASLRGRRLFDALGRGCHSSRWSLSLNPAKRRVRAHLGGTAP